MNLPSSYGPPTTVTVPKWGMTIASTVMAALIVTLVIGQFSQWEQVNQTAGKIQSLAARMEIFMVRVDQRTAQKLDSSLAAEMFRRRDDKIDSLSGRVFDNSKRIRNLYNRIDASWHPPLALPPVLFRVAWRVSGG